MTAHRPKWFVAASAAVRGRSSTRSGLWKLVVTAMRLCTSFDRGPRAREIHRPQARRRGTRCRKEASSGLANNKLLLSRRWDNAGDRFRKGGPALHSSPNKLAHQYPCGWRVEIRFVPRVPPPPMRSSSKRASSPALIRDHRKQC